MADCEQIIEQLSDYLQTGDTTQTPPSILFEHLVVCPHCQSAVQTLIRTIRLNADDRLTCEDVEGRLPEYTLANLASPEWAEVRLHLVGCPHCTALYRELLELEKLAEQESMPGRLPVGKPRLDFLPHRRTAVVPPWQIDALGRFIIAFSRETLAAMRAAAPAPQALAVKAAPRARPIGRLTLGSVSANIEATISIEERDGEPASCALVVEVLIPSRGGWPNLAGSEVRVAVPGRGELVRVTDAFGKVVITPLTRDDISAITITIVPVA